MWVCRFGTKPNVFSASFRPGFEAAGAVSIVYELKVLTVCSTE